MDISEPTVFQHSLDKSKVPPIHQKRILAFINQFIINTVTFLNDFVDKCDSKFITFETKLQKLESSLMIIESKLSSIPFDDLNEKNIVVKSDEITIKDKIIEPVNDVEEPKEAAVKVIEEETDLKNYIQICDHENYKKYFKMMQFGVPSSAVKQKMETDGIDPSILDTPHKMLKIEDTN